MHRRDLIRAGAAALAAGAIGPVRLAGLQAMPFRISLAQWSLHKTFYGASLQIPWEERRELFRTDPDRVLQGKWHPKDFPRIAREEFGLDGVEYVNTFMYGHATDSTYLDALARQADSEGVTSVLIMVDMEGALGDPDRNARAQAVENHVRWLSAAARLGCHAIRVNAQSSGTEEEQAILAADGLHALAEIADEYGLSVLVENHGGLSSRASWLMDVLRDADHPRLGTLPDFGNFTVSSTEQYDRYRGVAEMMPMARAVSAKSHDFDEAGNNFPEDFDRMMRIVYDAGYRGWVGIEYEGSRLDEIDGINATADLLRRIGSRLGD